MKRIGIERESDNKQRSTVSSTTKAFFENHNLTKELLSFFPTLERFDFQTVSRECARCVEPITDLHDRLVEPTEKPNANRRLELAKFIVSLNDVKLLSQHLRDETVTDYNGHVSRLSRQFLCHGFFLGDLIEAKRPKCWRIFDACSLDVAHVVGRRFPDLLRAQMCTGNGHLWIQEAWVDIWKGFVAFATRKAMMEGNDDGVPERFRSIFVLATPPGVVRLGISPETAIWMTLADPDALLEHEARALLRTLYCDQSGGASDRHWRNKLAQKTYSCKMVRRLIALFEYARCLVYGGYVWMSDDKTTRSLQMQNKDDVFRNLLVVLASIRHSEWCWYHPEMAALISKHTKGGPGGPS